jgi:predicted nucleotidyltransferase
MGQRLPFGHAKWSEVFSQLGNIRRWNIEETLRETGMIYRWRDLLQAVAPDDEVPFQIKLSYRRTPAKRQQIVSVCIVVPTRKLIKRRPGSHRARLYKYFFWTTREVYVK